MRLIDADAYKKHLASFVVGGEKAIVKNGIGNYWINGIHTAYREIDNVPTIKTFTLADIEEQYRKGMEKGLEERQHVEVFKYPDYVFSVIDKLLQDIESTATTYTVDGDTVVTDTGYADDGIEFFVKHLKERMKRNEISRLHD